MFRLLSLLFLPLSGLSGQTDRFGGFVDVQREATGFFRVEEIKGRWCFITPEGHPFIALGANHVGSFLAQQKQGSGLMARYRGNEDEAAKGILSALRELGMNAGDAYQPEPRYRTELPRIVSISYGQAGKNTELDVFDEAALKAVSQHVIGQCRRIAEDAWVIGIAGPDLPKWGVSRIHPYRIAKPDSPGRRRYHAFLREKYAGDITKLNAAYESHFPSFEALESKPRLNLKTISREAKSDDAAFAALIAETLFSTVRSACKAGAPNHLFLGERTYLRSIPDPVLEVMGRHVDVFCTQALILSPQRPPEWQMFQRAGYDHEYALVKKPIIIVDWAAPFSLGASFESEKGMIHDEAKASEMAAKFVTDAFEPPYMIGLFICQVIGTHPNDKWFDGKAKRTYLRDDGIAFEHRRKSLKRANEAVLQRLYSSFQ
jgi:hypothetical protein